MRAILFLSIFLVSCASQEPQRKLASEAIEIVGQHDSRRSLVQIFPARGEDLSYYLYVQLKDSKGKYVDVHPEDFLLKTKKGKRIHFEFERMLRGRYYLTINKTEQVESAEIDLFVQGSPLKEQFKLQMKRPHKAHSKLKLLSNKRHTLTFELQLLDQNKKPVEVPETPEILMNGPGVLSEMKHNREGVWTFSVIYPDENHITYFGVRTMGITLQNLYRYQHIEK